MSFDSDPVGWTAEFEMKIGEVSLTNFRCFRSAQIRPHSLCVLIGENDAGKTAVLHALRLVLGRWRPVQDDLFVDDPDISPRHREPMEVEIVLLPDDPGAGFDADDHALFAEHFDIATDGAERLRIKLRYGWDSDREEFRTETRFQKADGDGDEFTARYASRFGFFVVDALRDIGREIGTKTGLWGRLLASVSLSDAVQQQVSTLFSEANEALQSDADFSVIKKRFEELIEGVLGLQPGDENVRLSPVPQDAAEILRAADLHVRGRGSNVFLPISRHGLGSQSAAVIALFRTWVERGDVDHVFFGFEEPECHLHPHVQRYLFGELADLGAQVFVTTHSTFIADRADPRDIVHLRRTGAECVARQIPKVDPLRPGEPFLPSEWQMEIKRYVEGNNSEIFFARCILLVEGPSERYAMPLFARALDIDLDHLGISIVPANSHHFAPFMRICSPGAFEIPWVVLCDGDAVKRVVRQLEETGYVPEGTVKGVLQSGDLVADILEPHSCYALSDLPSGLNFERLLLSRGFLKEYLQAIEELDGANALDEFVARREAAKPGFAGEPKDNQVYEYVRKHGKPRFARRIAEAITAGGADASRMPDEFRRPLEAARAMAEAALGVPHGDP